MRMIQAIDRRGFLSFVFCNFELFRCGFSIQYSIYGYVKSYIIEFIRLCRK